MLNLKVPQCSTLNYVGANLNMHSAFPNHALLLRKRLFFNNSQRHSFFRTNSFFHYFFFNGEL